MEAQPLDITEVPVAQNFAKAVAEDIDRELFATINEGYAKGEHPVHCRDCKHYNTEPDGWCDMHSHYHDDDWGTCFDPDDYCSYGEHREEEE